MECRGYAELWEHKHFASAGRGSCVGMIAFQFDGDAFNFHKALP